MEENKRKKMYRESATVVLVDGAAVVVAVIVDGAAIVVDGAAVVVATVRTDTAVDKFDVFVPSCEVDLNLNLSLNFNREGIFTMLFTKKIVVWNSFVVLDCGVQYKCHPDNWSTYWPTGRSLYTGQPTHA